MKNPISQKIQIFELFYRPDSIHGDDDEDRIPEELLLKYTKTDDDLLPGEFPVETNNEEKEIANVILKLFFRKIISRKKIFHVFIYIFLGWNQFWNFSSEHQT